MIASGIGHMGCFIARFVLFFSAEVADCELMEESVLFVWFWKWQRQHKQKQYNVLTKVNMAFLFCFVYNFSGWFWLLQCKHVCKYILHQQTSLEYSLIIRGLQCDIKPAGITGNLLPERDFRKHSANLPHVSQVYTKTTDHDGITGDVERIF